MVSHVEDGATLGVQPADEGGIFGSDIGWIWISGMCARDAKEQAVNAPIDRRMLHKLR